jgi:hypothetical protein
VDHVTEASEIIRNFGGLLDPAIKMLTKYDNTHHANMMNCVFA